MTDPGSVPLGAAVEVRLLTYNVRGLRAGSSGVSAVIASAQPDVVCVQESPVRVRWRSRAAELARRSGLYVVTGGQPAAGNLMLCSPRVDVVRATEHRLTQTPGLGARGCTAALLRVGGTTVGVVGTHFGLRASERRRHADEIVAIADGLRTAGASTVVLAGDLNAEPTAPEWAPLRQRWRDTAPADAPWRTYPARAPQARIDVVLAEPDVVVSSCGLVDHARAARASDHRPVLAVLQVPSVG